MTEYLPQLLLAWSIQLTGVISPGPSVALILGVATAQGRMPALFTVAGIGSASVVLSLATVLGLTAIFAQVAGVMVFVKMIGAAYLGWLAYCAFRRAANPPPLNITQVAPCAPLRLALSGFVLQVSNPKAILFWVAIASVGGIGDAPWPIMALFVAGAFINSTVGHGLWAMILSAPKVRQGYIVARRPIEAVLGGFFAFAAFRLTTARI